MNAAISKPDRPDILVRQPHFRRDWKVSAILDQLTSIKWTASCQHFGRKRRDLNELFSSRLDHFIEASAIVYKVLPGYIRMDMMIDMGNITSRSKHEGNL
jgi:hypothetical protein